MTALSRSMVGLVLLWMGGPGAAGALGQTGVAGAGGADAAAGLVSTASDSDAASEADALPEVPNLSPDQVTQDEIAGDPITSIRTKAPGNDAPIGGLKVETEHGWFVARPSGTEAIYKIYAESFRGENHLEQLHADAQALVNRAFDASPHVNS